MYHCEYAMNMNMQIFFFYQRKNHIRNGTKMHNTLPLQSVIKYAVCLKRHTAYLIDMYRRLFDYLIEKSFYSLKEFR